MKSFILRTLPIAEEEAEEKPCPRRDEDLGVRFAPWPPEDMLESGWGPRAGPDGGVVTATALL